MPNLVSFKRRASNFQDRTSEYCGKKLRFLFAPGSSFVCVKFLDCEMDLSNFSSAQLSDVTLSRTTLVGTTFRGAQLADVTFQGCDLAGASFEGATLRNVSFERCSLEGASFLGATLYRPVLFRGSNLLSADLRFYESEAEAPSFFECRIEGITVSINCEFWNGTFDQDAVRDFELLLARSSKDEKMIAAAKEKWGEAEYERRDAYMRRV